MRSRADAAADVGGLRGGLGPGSSPEQGGIGIVPEAEESKSSQSERPAPSDKSEAPRREGARRPRGGRRGGRGRQRGGRRKRKRPCAFCVDRRGTIIDYKNVRLLRGYLDDRARIKKARQTGTCRKHQRKLARAVKRARELALVPYTLD